MSGDDPKSRAEEDSLERAEFERANEAFERSLQVKASSLVDPPDRELVMNPISFNGFPLIWLGEEHTVYVTFRHGERPTNRPLEVTWTSLDPSVLGIRETSRQGSAAAATLVGLAVGETKIVVTTAAGHHAELEIRVDDREQYPIQWF